MRVNCENCNTNFNLDEGLVKSTGSKVRCSKCKHIFVVYPSQPEAEEPEVEAPVTDDAAEEAVESSLGFAAEAEADDLEDQDADAAEEMDASEASAQDEEGEGEDLDLSDIEKMLESEAAPEATEEDLSREEADIDGDEASLDLSDIEKILDEEDDGDELLDEKADEDEDLVFDLDEELEIESIEEQISPTTELDLGDLEKMFESDEEDELSMDETLEPEEDDASMSLALDAEDGDLSLMPEDEEAEMSLETDEAVVEAPEEIGEPLGFDVGSEEAEDETLQMMDEQEAPSLDIDMEEDLSLEEGTEADETELASLDIEIGAEAEDSEEEALTLEGETKDLALESESLEIEDEDFSEPSDMLDSDLSEALEMALDGQEEEPELEDDEDISLEALEMESDEDELTDFGEDEELEYPDDAVPDIPDEDEEEMLYDEEEIDLGDVEEEEYEKVEPVASGSGVKKLLGVLAVLLVIVLLLAAFLFLNYKKIINVPFLDRIEIPFLSKQKAASVTDVGNLKITYNVDDYRFLETEKAGKLFLITGKIKNEYTAPRSFIQMSGSLYTKGKTLADTATAYCGNVIADLELSQMTPAAIRTRLGNRSGENDSNVNIKPGEERSFMIVFFDLPESLDEFTVSVRGSEEGGA